MHRIARALFLPWVPAGLLLATLFPGLLRAQIDDLEETLDFFQEEAIVVTASKMEQTLSESPSTVYVVTAEDIRTSGARTLWDALRSVPGVDVIATRTMQGEVNARGLNAPFNNRMLILVDGRTVLNGFFDFVTWETLPITMEEIDRIEIVEGPVSSLYGANAISGVINIITKRPEDLPPGVISTVFGEHNAMFQSAVAAGERGRFRFRFSASRRAADSYDSPGNASRVVKGNALICYRIGERTEATFQGGHVDHQTETVSSDNLGNTRYEGGVTYLRSDWRHRGLKFRLFWNRGRGLGLKFPGTPNVDYDTVDIESEYSLSLPFSNTLITGVSYRKNNFRSNIYAPGLLTQDLWAIFFQDEWKPEGPFTLIAGARLDRHPFTGLNFSPRGSVIYSPQERHTLRISAGTAFRNPTFTGNFLNLTQMLANPGTSVPNPPYTTLQATRLGTKDLDAEKIVTGEISYSHRFERIKNRFVGFIYELRDIISVTEQAAVTPTPPPPVFPTQSTFVNQGTMVAVGGEASTEILVKKSLTAYANYSYQHIHAKLTANATQTRSSPRHKVNAGVRLRKGDFSGYAGLHWVSATFWNVALSGEPEQFEKAGDYTLLNANLNYAFPAPHQGLSIFISVFNLLNDPHFELPQEQGGERISRRISGGLRYAF